MQSSSCKNVVTIIDAVWVSFQVSSVVDSKTKKKNKNYTTVTIYLPGRPAALGRLLWISACKMTRKMQWQLVHGFCSFDTPNSAVFHWLGYGHCEHYRAFLCCEIHYTQAYAKVCAFICASVRSFWRLTWVTWPRFIMSACSVLHCRSQHFILVEYKFN